MFNVDCNGRSVPRCGGIPKGSRDELIQKMLTPSAVVRARQGYLARSFLILPQMGVGIDMHTFVYQASLLRDSGGVNHERCGSVCRRRSGWTAGC